MAEKNSVKKPPPSLPSPTRLVKGNRGVPASKPSPPKPPSTKKGQ